MEKAAKRAAKRKVGGRAVALCRGAAAFCRLMGWLHSVVLCNGASVLFGQPGGGGCQLSMRPASSLFGQVGDPFTDVEQGPQVDEDQLKKVSGCCPDHAMRVVVTKGCELRAKPFDTCPPFTFTFDELLPMRSQILGYIDIAQHTTFFFTVHACQSPTAHSRCADPGLH